MLQRHDMALHIVADYFDDNIGRSDLTREERIMKSN